MEDYGIEMFVAGAAARTTAEITGVNRNTVRVFFQRCGNSSPVSSPAMSFQESGCSFTQPYIVLSSRTIVEAGGVRGTGSLCRFVCYLRLSKRGLVNQNN